MGDGFEGEGGGDGVAPELVAHAANGDGGGNIGDAGKFEVEGTDGEVGGAEMRGEECGEDVRRVVILPVRIMG